MRLKVIATLLLLAMSFLSKSLWAQYVRVGVSGPIAIGKLDEMQDTLAYADKAQKADLLTRLGVDAKSAKYAVDEMLDTDSISFTPIHTGDNNQFGVAFVPSSTGGFAALYLLKAQAESAELPWKIVDHQDLSCWRATCTLETMPRRSKKVDDLVLHHVNLGHGSDYVEDETQGFVIHNDKLQKTFSASDYLEDSVFGDGRTIGVARQRASEFLRFPDDSIEETQTVTLNDQRTEIRRRFWRWSELSRSFVPETFVTVSRRPAH